MSFNPVAFEKDSSKALKNEKLRRALVNVTDRFRANRLRAAGLVDDWDGLRSRARAIKKETIENLDTYLTKLEESVKRAGGKVHWAKDAREACDIIVGIARDGNVSSVVKSKSMATEEIELNSALEKSGIKAVETDLGEYIFSSQASTRLI